MEVTKDFLRPKIDTALSGITICKLNYRDTLRPKEEEKGAQPKPDCHPTIRCDAGNDVEIENCYDKQQHQVAASEDTLEVWLAVIGALGQMHSRLRNSSFKVSRFHSFKVSMFKEHQVKPKCDNCSAKSLKSSTLKP